MQGEGSGGRTDAFVDGILANPQQQQQQHFPREASLLVTTKDNTEVASVTSSKIEHRQWSSTNLGRLRRNDDDEACNVLNADTSSRYSKEMLQALFGYALIFINFTFIVASMLLIMSGIVARGNAAVRLCAPCGQITLAALVFGIILWLFTIFGFMWIRQRQMMFLLVYVGFLVMLFIALLVLIIAAAVYDKDARVSVMDPSSFFDAWERGVNDTYTGNKYDICSLQERFNCSGFRDGCCLPGECYNASDPPQWVSRVCPKCPPPYPPMTPVVCTDVVYSTVLKNLSGFLVISCFSMVLVVAGILFAFLSRRANRLMMEGVT
ncbi:hypothetical protein DQ04_03501020 [Trypanosoma grayi]|uniref:hypothetical protein n=1 Tax=Trypanosoma grayi TaxID=71804 RepID=UPI0004F47502|nr:hypothetical protein DQ04_03501020 [Trypanosoma grayi]KEG10618.1 hypothetical protein DQ04_03501020 [Trypanosoma grayi]